MNVIAGMLSALVLVLFHTPACSDRLSAHLQTHCDLQLPPSDAGENGLHGVIFKIYPRSAFIDAHYSGCQLMWIEHGETWVLFSVLQIHQGQIIKSTQRDDDSPLTTRECHYAAGRLAANQPDDCAQTESLYASEPAGCISLMDKEDLPSAQYCLEQPGIANESELTH